jgi:hypothetical protein
MNALNAHPLVGIVWAFMPFIVFTVCLAVKYWKSYER